MSGEGSRRTQLIRVPRLFIAVSLLGGSTLPFMETTTSCGPLRTSGSGSCSPSCSRWLPATYTSRTRSSSIPTTLISCAGRRSSTPTGTLPRTRTRVATSVTSNALSHPVFRPHWDLPPLRGELPSTVSDQAPRPYELLAEPTCQPAFGRRTVDLTLRPKRGAQLCAGYRVICLRRGQARRTYLTGRNPEQNIKCRSPVCGRALRRGDLALHQRRARTSSDFLFSPFHSRRPYLVIPPCVRSSEYSSWSPPSHPTLPSPLLTIFVHGVHRRSLFRPRYLIRICVGYWRAPPSHPLYFLVILHDNIAPTNAFPFMNDLPKMRD